MQKLELEQGTKEWLDVRQQCFTASDAPAMMGESKYKSRTQLLKEKKGWTETIGKAKQAIFDKGHESEDMARDLLESERLELFSPVVGMIELEGMKLLASFDGLSEDGKTVFEHKLYNATLAENVRSKVLEPTYYWQLEQQLLVSGADKAIFITSDGTYAKHEVMEYESDSEMREYLITSWKQFAEDLAVFELEAKQEAVVAVKQGAFPLIECRVEGSVVASNLGDYIPLIKNLAEEQMSLILETDQDFVNKEAFNKSVKEGRAALKLKAGDVETAFESLAEFNGYVKEADSILQRLQSHGEKQVKDSKVAKKLAITTGALATIQEHLAGLSETINKVQIQGIFADWDQVIKGKRSFEKMQEAVDSEIAKLKIQANEMAAIIRKNLDSLSELAVNHKFLFSDHAELLLKGNEDLVSLIKMRIAEHERAEAERLEQERQRIQAEEQAKAQREAEALAETERQRIREEERVKAEAEAATKAEAERVELAKRTVKRVETKEPPAGEIPLAAVGNAVITDKAIHVNTEEPSSAAPFERIQPEVPGTKIPHDCLNDLVEWSDKHDVSLDATADLETILSKYFV